MSSSANGGAESGEYSLGVPADSSAVRESVDVHPSDGNGRAAIDWSDADSVLHSGYTLAQLLELHPRLKQDLYREEHGDGQQATLSEYTCVFASPLRREEQRALIQQWQQRQLLGPEEGRTNEVTSAVWDGDEAALSTSGSGGGPAPAERKLTVVDKFRSHMQQLERQRIEEKMKRDQRGDRRNAGGSSGDTASAGGRGGAKIQRGAANASQAKGDASANAFTEERRRGAISRLDFSIGIGFVNIAEIGEIKFYTDRLEYGVKEAKVGDIVTLKVDYRRDYPVANDVRPAKSGVTTEDVKKFLERCRCAPRPMLQIQMLLMHRHEWEAVVEFISSLSRVASTVEPTGDVGASAAKIVALRERGAEFTEAVHTIANLTTFIENREPIHAKMLETFLHLLALKTPHGAFFPDLVSRALTLEAEDVIGRCLAQPVTVDQWSEVVDLNFLMRQFGVCPRQATADVEDAVRSLLSVCKTGISSLAPKCDMVLRRIQLGTSMESTDVTLFPTAAELSCPPPDVASVFSPGNLPVVVESMYTSTEEFILDHRKMLRADTYEEMCRVLVASCFKLPGHEANEETMSDVEHARIFGDVRFMGRVVTGDRDFSHPDSYILQLKARSARADPMIHLQQGTTVCITTGLDRSVMDPREIFWGTISSCNSAFLAAGMVVVTCCEGSESFERLVAHLLRNEAQEQSAECSLLLETSVFFSGYSSIMNSLKAFLGPLGMSLPLSSSIVSYKPTVKESTLESPRLAVAHPAAGTTDRTTQRLSTTGYPLVKYVPPHCESAFRHIIRQMQRTFNFDRGQEIAMERLPTAEVLLVQGPPGTGKSFIGGRIVETYVRYKKLMASGDALNYIDVGLLTSTRLDDALPSLGPVVVITYKNHALDEFLVDLLHSDLWNGNAHQPVVIRSSLGAKQDAFPRGRRLVRIGGRSKAVELELHNLSALLRSKADQSAIMSLKDRIYVMNQWLERLSAEIQQLERGRVPQSYFERWLTPEQRETMRFEDREEWLSGGRYIGVPTAPVEKTFFLTLIRSRIASAMAANGAGTAKPPAHATMTERHDEEGGDETPMSVFQRMKLEDEYREYNSNLHTSYFSAEALRLAKKPPLRPAAVPEGLQSLWSLEPRVRHEYYAYLIQLSIASKANDFLKIVDAIRHTVTVRNHAIDEAKLQILQGADVVGLTTTGCAMNQNLIRSLRPSVLVVEEAAEVLESQLLACMTDSLQQIILIGDHFQLKPKIDTFLYEKVNHMNVSMFERLAKRTRPIRLVEQRRMHPVLSEMVRPFYGGQSFEDHPMLLTRPLITSHGEQACDYMPGLAHRLFFWRHEHPEEEAPGSRSKINMKEISMVQAVVRHLVDEGVIPKSITVITPYLGQCRALRNMLRMHALRDVHVSTVDLFQGDENDVIVLSLVRTAKLTEFIKMRNRMIVACSRARFAMVMIGNEALLMQVPHWAHVINLLKGKNCIGEELPITDRSLPGQVRMLTA